MRSIFAVWLALPLVGLDWWRAWDRLPASMANHFDASWRANGWAPRMDVFEQSMGVTICALVVFTFVAILVRARRPSAFWPVVIVSAVAVVLQAWLNHTIIGHNLG